MFPAEGSSASRLRLGLALVGAAALALGVLGPAAARTDAAPKYGGTLFVGLTTGEPGSLDPTLPQSGQAVVIYQAMCQQLYDRNARQELVPMLAAAVPALSKDKLSYTIELRKGVLFNDGTPFNAQAVVNTIQRFMTYPGSGRASDYVNVDSVTASGPYTVVFRMKARDSTFIGGSSFILSPTQLAKLGDSFGTNPVCVGPFMFDHRVAGDHITLIKSPYYHGRKDVYLDKIVYKPFSGSTAPAASAAALKAGDIQALYTVSTTELPAIQQNSSLWVISSPQLGWSGVIFNMGNKNGVENLPYTNVGTPLASSAKLRQAFEEAIDRTAFNRVVYDGLMQVSCNLIPPANTLWYDATKVPCTPYDPKHAKKLVAESGFPNPTVHLLCNSSADTVRKAQFIQAQEAAVGINVVIETADLGTVNARERSGDFDIRIRLFAPGGVDPHSNIYGAFATSGPVNYMGYSNPRLDLILANGLKATSVKARSTLYHVAQQIIQADRPVIVLYNPTIFVAFSSNLTGVGLAANTLLDVEHARYK